MIKKVFKLIFISIISILLISCTGDLFNPKPKYDLEVLVMKKDYLPITVKLLDSSNEETIGSVTTSDQDENGNYKATFKVEPDDYGSYYKINIYKNLS